MQTVRSLVPARSFLGSLALLCALAAPGCTSEAKSGNLAIQAVVDETAKKNPDIVRLTVHNTSDGKNVMAVASTLPAKIGKASDKEDVQAIESGKTVVLDEPNALDVTVPVLQKDGKYTAAIGVTLKATADSNKETLKAKALEIANAVATAITAKK